MMRNIFYLFILIVLPTFICSSLNIENDSKSNNFDKSFEQLRNHGKRHLLKRIQIPFKWGKRSLFTNTDSKELCADFFAVLITQNKKELNKLKEFNLKKVYNDCFNLMINMDTDLDDFDNSQYYKDLDEEEISIKGNTKAELLKRSNIPFRWG